MRNFVKNTLIFVVSILFLFLIETPALATEILTSSINSSTKSTDVSSQNSDSILIMNASNKTNFHETLDEGLELSIDDNLPTYNLLSSSTIGLSDEDIIANINCLISKNVIKLIICLDESSTSFFTKYRSDHFTNIPVLFAYEGDNSIKIGPNMGGIYIPYKIDTLMDKILPLHPKTTQVNFLLNKDLLNTYFHKKILEYIDNNDNSSDKSYNIVIAGLSEDVFPKLCESNSLNIIYSSVRFKLTPDDPGKFLAPYGSLQKLSRATDNPSYGGFKGYGTRFNVGSYIYDGFKDGYELGNLAFDLLTNKTLIENIGISEVKSTPNLFINKQLQSYYDIPDNIPHAIYYNLGNTESTYVTNKIKILTFITFTAVCLLFTFAIRGYFKRKSLKEEKKLDSIKTNFIANVSHELRTPLNIIISTIQLFDIYTKNGDIVYHSDRAKEKMKYLKGNSLRLLRLVNNIIDITRIDSGYFTINKESVNIVSLVEEVTLSSVAYAEKKEINLIFDTDAEEIILSVDTDRIERVILNLLSNSLKFTPANGTITVSIFNTASEVSIIVKDTGMGIPSDKFETIFKRFRQVDGTTFNKSEGSGIGLALCKSMIEMHNGSISVESELNKGSSFIITLPYENCFTSEAINLKIKNTDDVLQVEYSDFANYL